LPLKSAEKGLQVPAEALASDDISPCVQRWVPKVELDILCK